MLKTEILKNEILDKIGQLDIAGYLKEDIKKLLGYFHYYKMNNIYKNIDFLVDYLSFLDQKSTDQISKLNLKVIKQVELEGHDINYYISNKGLDVVGEDKIKQMIYFSDFGLNSVMLGIKGFLMLTMDEFCNATSVRLSIDQYLWNKEKSRF